MEIEDIARQIVDSAVKIHKALRPGLLESAYQKCLTYELTRRGLHVDCEVMLPVHYLDIILDAGYRADMIIENSIIVENKTVDQLAPIHEAQLLTYLKLGDYRIGFLLNWNSTLMKYGIKRMVNDLPVSRSLR